MRRTIAMLLISSFTVMGCSLIASAHEPNRQCQPVHPRVDLIGPLGTNLPPSYRRQLNRPRYLTGRIAYAIAPSSQEAMAWHKADHQCAYSQDAGRIERHYFYPKPWEALKVGPRRTSDGITNVGLTPLGEGETAPLMPHSSAPKALSDNDDFAAEVIRDTIIDEPVEADDDMPEPLPSPSPSDLDLDLDLKNKLDQDLDDALEKVKDLNESDMELPAPKALELPTPKASELPAPKASELPAPKASELPAPKTSASPALGPVEVIGSGLNKFSKRWIVRGRW